MGKWRKLRLGDVIELKRGYDLPKSRREDGSVPLVSSSGISDTHSKAKVTGPGVVTGRYGTIGNVFYVENDFWPLNTTLYVKDFKGSDPRFVSYFLQSIDYFAFSDKAAVPGVNRNHLHQAEIHYPVDLEEQRAIASVLSALDNKIEVNRRMNGVLEGMARALYRDWFVDFGPTRARMAGHAPYLPDHLWSLFPDTLNTDGIPEGWARAKLGDVVEVLDRKRVPLSKKQRSERQGVFPYYGATSVMDHVDDYLFDQITVLMGEDGSVVKADGRPFTQYVWGKYWVNNHAHVLSGSTISSEWVKVLLDETNVTSYVTGAVQPKINQRNMKQIPLVLPCNELKQSFTAALGAKFGKLRTACEENQWLVEMRDFLLPRLISGQIRVAEVTEKVEEALA